MLILCFDIYKVFIKLNVIVFNFWKDKTNYILNTRFKENYFEIKLLKGNINLNFA